MTWNDEVKFGPPTPKKMRTVSPTFASSGCSFDKAPTAAVEDEIFRPLVQQFLDIEFLAAVLAKRRFGVDLALHHIEFAVDRRQPFFGLHQDKTVHSVRDVVRHHRRGAVVDIKPRDQRFEFNAVLFARIGLRRRGAAARPGGRMEIDRVNHRAVAGILQADIDGVADTNAQEWTRHLAVECPVAKRRAFGEAAFQLNRRQIDADGLRCPLANRRRQIGCNFGNVSLDQRLRWWLRGDQELPLHAGELVARQAAEIDEVASFAGAERDIGAGALAGDVG